MKLIDSKKREKLFYELLNERYGPFPEPEHADSPDFLIHFHNQTLGVECTEIYSREKTNGISLKQQEERKDRIIENAKQFVIKNNIPPIHITVMFSESIEKEREGILTIELIKAVINNYPAKGEMNDVEGWEDGGKVLPDEIKHIYIANIPGYKNHVWHFMEVWCPETDFTEQLQSEIDRKSEKVANYLKKCDECWLIVSALGFSRSTAFKPSKEMLEHIYNSPFERVFFVEAFSRDIVELKVNAISGYGIKRNGNACQF